MPKRNAGFRAKSKGLCIFMKSLNLWDLALNEKKKSKTKSFSFVRRRKLNDSLHRTTLSRTVVQHFAKIKP